MRTIYKIIILSILLFLAISCTNKSKVREYVVPEFKSESELAFSIINDDIITPALVYDMDVYGNYLIFLYPYANKWVHIYDKTTGTFLKSIIGEGRGPSEVINSVDFSINQNTGDFYIFDLTTKKLLNVNINNVLDTILIIKQVTGDYKKYNRVYMLNDEIAITDRHHDLKIRYSLLHNNELQFEYYDYPIDDEKLRFNLYGDYRLSFSPDGKKMVAGTLIGAILEGFDLNKKINLKWVNYYMEPLFNKTEDQIDYKNSGIGFADVYATNNYIYTSYGGSKDWSSFKNIALFDWNGTPLRIIKTDQNIMKICYDTHTKTLYSLLSSIDGNYSIGYLKLEEPF